MKRIFMLLAMTLWPAVCHALPDKDGSYQVLGQGTIACETWMKERAKQSQPMQENITWVTGYLTAFNTFGPGSGDVTKGMKIEQVLEGIDAICAKYPELNLSLATQGAALALEQVARKK